MDAKSLTGAICGLAIVIILLAAFLVPTINDAASTTYTNAASNDIEYDAVEDFTISKEASSTDVTINGETFSVTGATDLLVASDNFVINRANNAILLILPTGAVTAITALAFSGTCTDGSLTYTVGTDAAATLALTNIYVATTDGEYVSVNDNSTVYVEDNSDIYAWTWKNGALLVYNGSEVVGSPENQYTAAATFTYTIENNQTSKNQMSFTYNGDTIANNTLIVPKTIVIHETYSALLTVIPIVFIAALVFGAARIFMGARD